MIIRTYRINSGVVNFKFLLLTLLYLGLNTAIYGQYSLVDATNEGQVNQRNVGLGTGNVTEIRNKLISAGIPDSVVDSRLTQGEFASHIAATTAMQETAAALDDRPDTYTGSGTIVTASNLDALRDTIEGNGGTFIFRDTINLNDANDRILVGTNTTIWVDGEINYTGPVIPGTIPDDFSVSDVLAGVFEVVGAQNNSKVNVNFYGTKRSKVNGNKRIAGVYTRWVNNLVIEGINFITSRNVLFVHNSYGNSRIEGNYIYDAARRGIHIKASSNLTIKNNLLVKCEVDGVDIDAYASYSNCIGNVVYGGGTRLQYWTEIAVNNCLLDGNIGIHSRSGDGGFQENGSEHARPDEPPTRDNTWINNHVFYADDASNYRQGFSFHPGRKIDRPSTTFKDNIVWHTNPNVDKHNPKTDDLSILDDAFFHLYDPTLANSITITSSPLIVASGEDIIVNVDYVSTGQNELVALVNGPDGTWLMNSKQIVNNGAGSATLTVIQPSDWSVGTNYKLEVQIRPVNTSYFDRLDFEITYFEVCNSIHECSCESMLLQTNNQVLNQSIHVSLIIESNHIIDLNADIEFTAGQYIQLTPGFEVLPSAIFHAWIEECGL